MQVVLIQGLKVKGKSVRCASGAGIVILYERPCSVGRLDG